MSFRVALTTLAIIGCAFGLFSPNPWLTVLAVMSLCAIILITWRPEELPALTFACLMQWISSGLAIFRADLQGVELWTLSYSQHIEEASALSLISVVVFGLAGRIGLGWRGTPVARSAFAAPGIEYRLLWCWLGASIIAIALRPLARGGLAQLVFMVGTLKWVPVLALFAAVLQRRRNFALLGLVFTVEFAVGALSFFSDFKRPVYLLAIAMVASQRGRRMSGAQVLGATVVAAFALYLGVIWSAVKEDYRDYMSGYSGRQAIEVSAEEQSQKLITLVTSLDTDALSYGAERLADRLEYVDFFGAAMDHVPAALPHQEGSRILGAFQHTFMPRLFFPDKDAIDDSADTERFTGRVLTNAQTQTSISLGYPAEAYVDAGPYFMFVIIFFLGACYGLAARYFTLKRADPVFGSALAVHILLGVASLEMAFTKMIGSLVTLMIVSEIVWRVVIPRLSPWLWGRRSEVTSADANAFGER